ncbi:WD40/YVTN/BNR-like repeat-containing protein [Marinigracilibium pacificum]|uniref:Glycosyl hydrolase n=1 Tax=Marinigracilibium pacificum TaxID=2729599 RepID=A0A848J126_9BACT|nr:exo-alpha-sialidase [Marinigracilibium pacificum]NMM48250.1 glycosyl hydrolase [Marinigracilibium pacificum]
MNQISLRFLLLSFFILTSITSYGQESIDFIVLDAMTYRSIGPYRGGRSAAVTGVTGKPNLFYFGSTGGGVWKSTNGGNSWQNISDGFFGGSIGAVAVSEYDNNVIYVGGGEKTVRGNMSYGYGMWKSVDAGKTWKNIGLKNSRHIPRIKIHPKNPDIVYTAVLGNVFKPGVERGVYRSYNGGETWEKILYTNDRSGAVDLIMDPTNPRILYASTWNIQRTPYSLESGGPGSALWKSIDGGDNWIEISKNEGFAKGTLGIIGVTVSPVNNEIVYAIAESDDGGVFKSVNGGDTWEKVNDKRDLRQRAWYYTRIYADPQNADKVYVLNVQYHVSEDGGKTFSSHVAPHGDHHDLWIAPEDPSRMIIGDDGGAQISFDGGNSWSTYHNQPTAQFYRVTTDNHFPYRIYGAQQDNSTVRILHRTEGSSIDEDDWESTAGGESAHIAVDPENNEIVYGGSYGGFFTRYNHDTKQINFINVWPDNPMGYAAKDIKYRFQWNFPILFSPHDNNRLYTASQYLHVSTDEGKSWKTISPDLTRNDTSKMGASGGPITKDNTSVEYYGTVFAIAESQHEEGVIYTGSDDGLIYITRDGGENWKNITPVDMPEWLMVNSIEIDPFNEGGMYFAATGYKSGNFAPFIYKTDNYGKSWKKITTGISDEHFTRVVRADPMRKGLLYAGTESGMYISLNDGASWQPFQLNLPIVPITDLVIKNNNLIVATQGRSFWLIDDLTPIHQYKSDLTNKSIHIFEPKNAYQLGRSTSEKPIGKGENHPAGVMIYYYLKDDPDSLKGIQLSILDSKGDTIKTFSTVTQDKELKFEAKKGSNLFVWDMYYPSPEKFDGMILWGGGLSGPIATPGKYKAVLSSGVEFSETNFTILKDPRSDISDEDYQAKFNFITDCQSKLSETHLAIKSIRKTKKSIDDVLSTLSKEENKELFAYADSVVTSLDKIENELYQTKNRSPQDPLNYPIKMNNRLSALCNLAQYSDYPPTNQMYEFKAEITAEIDQQLKSLKEIFNTDIPELNKLINQSEYKPLNATY